MRIFFLGSEEIALQDSYTYLGIPFHKNGSFKLAITALRGKSHESLVQD